jgi:N-acyl-D-aspartate/D-glutamate deacylase
LFKKIFRLKAEATCLSVVLACAVVAAQPASYDLVIRGGRVIDPETGLDAVRDIGIAAGRIAAISAETLNGKETLVAHGLVVSPGFIDVHTHVEDATTYKLAVQDGVTSVLEMEIGVPDVAAFYDARRGKAPVNYGAAASHPWSRVLAFGEKPPAGAIVPPSTHATDTVASDADLREILKQIERGLDAGAPGVGMGLAYTPGATRRETIEVFRVAAAHRVPVFVHVRSSGRIEPGSSIEAVSEVIAAAAVTGASLHIVHVNSSCTADAQECLRMVGGARARGLDVTTEGYPYGAGMTDIRSGVFNPGWQQRLGITEHELAIPETGERLTPQSFAKYRGQPDPRLVLVYTNPDDIVDSVITHPLTMIASDAVMQDGRGHPRAAGTFARILARYVREQRSLTLMDAIRKMSLMPAQRLERGAPAARRKGRLQVGADADITVFDLDTVADRATYASPSQPSAGFKYVLVNGVPVVKDGKLLDATPGRPLTSCATLPESSGARTGCPQT